MQKLKISQCAVQSILKKLAQLLTDQDAADPRSTTLHEDRKVIRLSLANRKACSRLLKSEFEDAAGQSISTRTVTRRLFSFGIS